LALFDLLKIKYVMMNSFFLSILLFVVSANGHAEVIQGDSSADGIRFVQGLTWEKVVKRAKKENKYIFVDCYTTWCGPCKRFGPVYEKASEEYDGIVFAKLDTDANYELTSQLGIEGIPTLMAFREGVLVFNQAGALPGQALKQVLEAVKGLDMEEVHAQVAKLQAEHEHSHE